jgi:hypothetical protein
MEHETSVRYRFGQRAYSCVLERRTTDPPPSALDPITERLMREVFRGYDPVKKLLDTPAANRPGVAEAFGGTANTPR